MEEPIVRDLMPIERTILANERAFLAFWRTALTLFIAGLTFLQFFENKVVQMVGWVFMPTSVAVFIQGVRVYRKMYQVIKQAEQAVEMETSNRCGP